MISIGNSSRGFFRNLVRRLTAWAWEDEIKCKWSLHDAMRHVASMQAFMRDSQQEPDQLNREIVRLRRLLRATRESYRKMKGRAAGGVNLNWPILPSLSEPPACGKRDSTARHEDAKTDGLGQSPNVATEGGR